MKRTYFAIAGIVGLAALPLSVGAAPFGNGAQFRGQGAGAQANATRQYQSTVELTAEEKATIQRMLEEEKLAGDLYAAFYEKWGNEVFTRIATSEARHESAVTRLVTTYGVEDRRTDTAGTYTDSELQATYDKLYADGMQSEAAALEAARQFEIDDIAGLKASQAMTSVSRLDHVFGNHQRASENHLREFTDAKNAL